MVMIGYIDKTQLYGRIMKTDKTELNGRINEQN